MKKRRTKPTLLLAGCLMAGLVIDSAAVVVQTSQSSGSSASAFDALITSNLLQSGQPSLASATADTSAISGTFSATGLNDGAGLPAGNVHVTYYAAVAGSGTYMPNTAIFQLTAGYNITNIQVISGWSDHNLGEQMFRLFLSINGGAFADYGTFTNNTPVNLGFTGPGSWLTTLTDSTGTIATNVTGLKFVFMNPDPSNGANAVGTTQSGDGSTGGTVIHELEVFGTYYTNLAAGPSGAVIPVNDTNVLSGLTVDDWVCTTNFIGSTVEGAALRVGFKGTQQVALRVDNNQFSGVVASRYPIIAWSVNNGPVSSHQLAAGETSVVLATGVTNPVIDLYIQGMSPFEDRYSGDVPPDSVKFTGFLVDSNAVTSPVAQPRKGWLNIGDSILAGDAALYAAGQGRPPDDDWAAADDGRASYGYLLARHYGYQETRLAYGGYNWGGGLANVPALSTLIDQKTSTISRLSSGWLNPIPEVVLLNLGENGVPALADVTNALAKLRSRVNASTKVLVMIPVSGASRTAVTQGFSSYTNSTQDANAFLVDLGSISYPTADGQHPTAQGHEMIFQDALPFFDPIIAPAILQSTQYGAGSTAFDGAITVNLIQAGQSSLSSVTASHSPSIATLFSGSGVNDGSAANDGNLSYYGNTDSTGGNLPVTITFNLNTNFAPGYNITKVQAITGWSDSDLANQNFELLFATNGGPFISCGVYINNTNSDAFNNGNNAILETLTSSSLAPIASHVTAVQFVFSNPGGVQGGSGGTLVRELQVFGTPNLAPPVLNQPYISGSNLVLSATGGMPNSSYTWLRATNLSTPLANWKTNSTGTLDSNGAVTEFIPTNATTPASFFRLRLP